MGLLSGKTALIVGIASKKSIAYGIAKSFHEQGAQLAFTYQNEKLKSRVEGFAEEFGSSLVFPCDVASDVEINDLKTSVCQHWSTLDVLVHSVGYAPGHELEGDMVDVSTREGFKIAHDISSYSFIALTSAFKDTLSETASVLTLTYHGSTQTLPNYNVMGMAKASLEAGVRYLASNLGPSGIRVNAISAGPIRTLAASGIKSFRKMLKDNAQRAPLRRNVTIDEVGNTAMFLASDLSSGITGEIMYVDAGFNTCAISSAEMLEQE
ncbi:enoyl-ACP reductase FabI [Pseudomonas sp. HK3]|jgi:enoyl-[acyl-carrier protein] reductase I